jgi:polyisoprenoid-binding protein YceI
MNKFFNQILVIIALLTIIAFTGCNKKEETKVSSLMGKKEIQLDVNRSTINWTVYKNNVQHTGTIKFLNGRFNLDTGVPVSGNCEVDLNSIKITDIKDSVESIRVLDYLKSKNFLYVEKYPSAKVNIRSMIPLRYEKMPNVNTTVKGSITIKDSTMSTVVTALTSYYQDSVVSRSKFSLLGANWNIPFKSISIDKDYRENPYKDNIDFEVYMVAK